MQQLSAETSDDRLTLQSQIAELKLVLPWVEALAHKYSITPDTQFAIDLCLEEAISNVIRHGCAGDPNRSVTVECVVKQDWLNFIIEDSAPPFALLEAQNSTQEENCAESAAAPASIEDLKVGGQGIHLIRRFASSVAWEPLPIGNRLTLGFRRAQQAL